jgi:hypothetical protein
LDSDGEGVLGDEAVGDVDYGALGLDADVCADVRFCVEVAEAPAYTLFFSISLGHEGGKNSRVEGASVPPP